jgi:glycosyltransferase involved in cell wall biosynthesis
LYLMLVHQASLIVGVSSAVMEEMRRAGTNPESMRVIQNGIDPHRLDNRTGIDPRMRFGIPPHAFVVGTAGSLIPRKATALVLEAFATLRHSRLLWLLVAGDGPDRAELMSLAARLGIADRTTFVGSYRDAGPIFRAMDVHVLASRDEAFGLVLIEAAMCGVPSIASDLSGIREVVSHGRTGLLVPAGEPARFAAAIQLLANDQALSRRLAITGQRDAIARFGAPRMAADFQGAYADLLALAPGQVGWKGTLLNAGPYARLLTGRLSHAVKAS